MLKLKIRCTWFDSRIHVRAMKMQQQQCRRSEQRGGWGLVPDIMGFAQGDALLKRVFSPQQGREANRTAPKVEPADGWLSHLGKSVEQVPEYHTQTTSSYERTFFPHWQAPTFIYLGNTNVGWLLTSFFSFITACFGS